MVDGDGGVKDKMSIPVGKKKATPKDEWIVSVASDEGRGFVSVGSFSCSSQDGQYNQPRQGQAGRAIRPQSHAKASPGPNCKVPQSRLSIVQD